MVYKIIINEQLYFHDIPYCEGIDFGKLAHVPTKIIKCLIKKITLF